MGDFGRYTLIETLAKGGMAEVHLAREAGGEQRLVALKQILPHLGEDPEFLTMFLDEARIAARLHHPNVVEIYDLGQHDGALYIAMEFVHGEDLRRIERRCAELSRPFPPALACRIVREACKGLDYAHKRTDAQGRPLGIVHRDVSPQNLLVTFEGVTKVVDFGVAKAAGKAHITQSGLIKGKHPYMSPEQALGQEELDCRTDVFALGIVLYEAVTGVRLFRRGSDLQTLRAVAECEVVPPSKVVAGLPSQLDDILLMALARDRDRRFQTAAELGSALESFAGSDPEAGAIHVGRFVSELFAERLQREARARKFAPSYGVTPLATPAAVQRLEFDKAKTIELGLLPVPQPNHSPDAVTRESPQLPGGTGTQAYGQRLPVPTMTTQPTQPAQPNVADPLAALKLPADRQRTILEVEPGVVAPTRRVPTAEWEAALKPAPSPLRRVFLIAGLALAGAAAWFFVARQSGPARAPVLNRIEPCARPMRVVTLEGKRWVEAPLTEGAALMLLSGLVPHTSQRDVYGMAMVVERLEQRSRIFAENLEAMPDDLYACPK
ncbi:MAG: serine/threonine protein kinase [Myxococcaceae bacterium]|nr:serine/threonine protein kinase [Myxococcaceae bacterium]